MNASTSASLRVGGVALTVGAVLMFAGGVLTNVLGGDLFLAMESPVDRIPAHLDAVAAHRVGYAVNLGLWLAGILAIGLGGATVAAGETERPLAAAVARFAFTATPAAALLFFSLMLGVVVGLAPAHAAGQDVLVLTRTLGFAATGADWLATALVLAVGGGALAALGRDRWAPRWLQAWAGVVGVFGVVTVLAVVLDVRAAAFPIVPVGLAYLVACGVLIIRSAPDRHRGSAFAPAA